MDQGYNDYGRGPNSTVFYGETKSTAETTGKTTGNLSIILAGIISSLASMCAWLIYILY